jgi:hypothetical protein
MSGLDVAVNVATIVSSFLRVQKAIENIATRRQDLSPDVKAEESRLLRVLRDGPQKINTEYNNGARRIGPSFSRGDGITRLRISPDQFRDCNLLSDIDRSTFEFLTCGYCLRLSINRLHATGDLGL